MSTQSFHLPQEHFPKGQKFQFSERIQYADGAVVSKILLRNQSGNLTLFAFDKGQLLSEHTAPFDALVHIIEGEAEIIIDGHKTILLAGESIIMPANIPHAVIAIEKFKMLLTMIKG